MNTGSKLFIAALILASCATLMAQGYVYTFQGALGYHQLDGSYVVLSNTVPGTPTLADLVEVKIRISFSTQTLKRYL